MSSYPLPTLIALWWVPHCSLSIWTTRETSPPWVSWIALWRWLSAGCGKQHPNPQIVAQDITWNKRMQHFLKHRECSNCQQQREGIYTHCELLHMSWPPFPCLPSQKHFSLPHGQLATRNRGWKFHIYKMQPNITLFLGKPVIDDCINFIREWPWKKATLKLHLYDTRRVIVGTLYHFTKKKETTSLKEAERAVSWLFSLEVAFECL